MTDDEAIRTPVHARVVDHLVGKPQTDTTDGGMRGRKQTGIGILRAMTTLGTTLDHLQRAGFEIRDVHALREHYAPTIRAWARRFEDNIDQFRTLAGAEQIRVWRLYLAGVALAFEQNRMGVDQILATRTTADGHSGMPWTRC